MGNPRYSYVAETSRPDTRQRQPQTNIRKCGIQPANESMPAVVETLCLLLCSTTPKVCLSSSDEKGKSCRTDLQTNIRGVVL